VAPYRKKTRTYTYGAGAPPSESGTPQAGDSAPTSAPLSGVPISTRRNDGTPESAIDGLPSRRMLDNLYDGAYLVDDDDVIVYWNPAAEQITGYSAAETVGQRCSDGILAHVDGQGACLCGTHCPRRSALHTGLCTETATFLRHKDGHRVPVSMRAVPLESDRPRSGGTLAIFRTDPTRGMAAELDELRSLALLDPLTKLPNRRFCEMVLAARLEEMRRYYSPFGVLFFDVDDFKQINDTHGHEVGDRALHMVAQTLSNNCRLFDIVGRWGGEEFVAIIVNVGTKQLAVAAEKFRALIESASLSVGSTRVGVTVSVGGAVSGMDDTPATMVKRADELMYRSKASGKNRATVA
jgi:diguanylate cyclase (GGDEF)-like protein/PAS domain S-box-containing protein